jgi:hypothetical protein
LARTSSLDLLDSSTGFYNSLRRPPARGLQRHRSDAYCRADASTIMFEESEASPEWLFLMLQESWQQRRDHAASLLISQSASLFDEDRKNGAPSNSVCTSHYFNRCI